MMERCGGSHVIVRTFAGDSIEQRGDDGYLNATAMCQANGKTLGHYLETGPTKEFLNALSADIGKAISELVQVRRGGNPQLQGTWVHPDVAIHLAQWCSPKFAVQVSKWVRELLTTGSVAVQNAPVDPWDMLVQQATMARNLARSQRETEAKLAVVQNQLRSTMITADHALDVATTYTGCMTVACYLSQTNRACDEKTAAKHGRKLSAIMRERGLTVTKLKHPKYPSGVSSYPEDVLAEYFGDPAPRLKSSR
jgi:hypothetical protein